MVRRFDMATGDNKVAIKVREIEWVEIAEHDDDISISEADADAATKVSEIQNADYDAMTLQSEVQTLQTMRSEVQILQSEVQTLQNHLERKIEKADLVGGEGRLEVGFAEHNDDNISVLGSDGDAATAVREIEKADYVVVQTLQSKVQTLQGEVQTQQSEVQILQGQAGPDHRAGPAPTAEPSRPPSQRSASRRPFDFCEKASRWRDRRGRFCRPPSPVH